MTEHNRLMRQRRRFSSRQPLMPRFPKPSQRHCLMESTESTVTTLTKRSFILRNSLLCNIIVSEFLLSNYFYHSLKMVLHYTYIPCLNTACTLQKPSVLCPHCSFEFRFDIILHQVFRPKNHNSHIVLVAPWIRIK